MIGVGARVDGNASYENIQINMRLAEIRARLPSVGRLTTNDVTDMTVVAPTESIATASAL